VTKSGDIAGPKILEHVVDVVLYMEVCPISLPLFLFCCPFPSIFTHLIVAIIRTTCSTILQLILKVGSA
jgi:hypothetical protein